MDEAEGAGEEEAKEGEDTRLTKKVCAAKFMYSVH